MENELVALEGRVRDSLYVIHKKGHLSIYDSDELSKRYAEQIERGVIVLEDGDTIEILEEAEYELEEDEEEY